MNQEKTLKQLIIDHDNNYDFSVVDVVNNSVNEDWVPHSLTVVIPYYETGEIFDTALKHLYAAINYVKQKTLCEWKFEVIVIDDGSKNKKACDFLSDDYKNLNIILLEQNSGRVIARNAGLNVAKYAKCLFMDSDVLIAKEFLFFNLLVHSFSSQKVITVGFFQFIDDFSKILKRNRAINCSDIKLNDYRIDCTYGETWIGCEDDKKSIGNKYKILEETDYFRKWPKKGFFGPWFLTNMVLGGFFIVDTKDSKKCHGFDLSFKGYGFTETSLPTKLIAGFDHFLVPVHIGGCIHIDDYEVNVSRKEKDKIFWEKHDFYFNNYLKLNWQQALNGYENK
jgi:glycosyltransferase involved in cell wall biosynthesis